MKYLITYTVDNNVYQCKQSLNNFTTIGETSYCPAWNQKTADIYTHTHTCLTALCLGLPGSASTRKVKPIWILLEQETVSGSGISWATCKSASRSRQTTTPAPHHSVFTGRVPFLPPNQQRQSTEGKSTDLPVNN